MTLEKEAPDRERGRASRKTWIAEASELIASPGEWHVLARYPAEKAPAGRQLATDVKGGRLRAFRDRGDFDAKSRKVENGEVVVYARFLGESVTLEPPVRTDGTPILPNQSPYNEILANLATLNEIMSDLFNGWLSGEKPDPEYVELVTETLKEHNWKLGFRFRDQKPTTEFLEREKLS